MLYKSCLYARLFRKTANEQMGWEFIYNHLIMPNFIYISIQTCQGSLLLSRQR